MAAELGFLGQPPFVQATGELHVVLGSGAGLDDLAARLGSQGHALIQLGSDQDLADLNTALAAAVSTAGGRFEAIHLYGHAAAARLQIGRDLLTGDALDGRRDALQQLGQALTANGDLLLYGCELASGVDGRAFVERLSALTGADVAASDDITGQAAAGGDAADWTLEVQVGSVESRPIPGDALGWGGTLSAFQEPIRLISTKQEGESHGILDVTLRAHRGVQALEVGDPTDLLKPGVLTEVDGFMTYAWTLNTGTSTTGALSGDNEQGPTLQVNPGDVLRIRLENDLGDQPTNLHTHGLLINPSGNSDNVLLSIPPGYANIYEYKIPEDQEPGVNWYHPHRHEYSADQVYRGLAGFLVIGNGNNDIAEIKDLPFRLMMIQAQTIGKDAQGKTTLLPLGFVDSSDDKTIKAGGHYQMTVNGQYMPDIDLESQYEAWVQLQVNPRDLVRTFYPRFTSADSSPKDWNFANLDNIKTYFVAQDGEAFPTTVGKTRVNLEPGGSDDEAMELLRKRSGGFATALAPGKRVTEVFAAPKDDGFSHYFAATAIQPGSLKPDGKPRQYMQPLIRLKGFENGGDDNYWDNRELHSTSIQYEDLSKARVDVVREITFETKQKSDGTIEFMINGEVFPNTPVIQPRAGQVEEWRVTNLDSVPHPIHLHMQSFQAEAVSIGDNGYTIPPHYYDSDVWYMDPKAINVFRIRWKPTLGESVFHCHNLFHEDGGMMAGLNVIPEQPYLVAAEAAGDGKIAFYGLETGDQQTLLQQPSQIVSPFDDFEGPPDYKPIRYTGGLAVAMGDVDSDGIPDALVAQQGRVITKNIEAGRLLVLSGRRKFRTALPDLTGQPESILDPKKFEYPFGPNPGFDLNVTVADVNGDTYGDVIVAGGVGADGTVKVFSGRTGDLLSQFKAIDTLGYRGGVSLAAGNVDGSGRERILTAPASGAAPEVSIWGWDLFTKIPLSSASATATSPSASGVLGEPIRVAKVLAGSARDRRGLTLATTYYGISNTSSGVPNAGYRRILTAPASKADRATLWTLDTGHSGHAGHGSSGGPATTAKLKRLTDLRPRSGTGIQGFSLASVSTTQGSLIAMTPRGGGSAISTFLPSGSKTFAPRETLFRPQTFDPRKDVSKLLSPFSFPVRLAGS